MKRRSSGWLIFQPLIELISKSHGSPNNQEWSKNHQTCETDIESLVPQGNSPESEFEPSKESLNSSSFLVWPIVKSSWSPSGWLLPIALIRRDATFYTSFPKIASYWFSIVSSICQDLSRFCSRPSSAYIDSYVADYLLKSPAIMFIARTYNYYKRKGIRTDSCMSLHSLASLMSIVPCGLAAFFESISVLSTAKVSKLSLPSAWACSWAAARILFQTPSFDHHLSLRQAVWYAP